MPATHLSANYAALISPLCPTCGKKMEQTSASQNSEGVIYGFLCSTDGDRLSWQPGHPNKAFVKSRERVDVTVPNMIGRHKTKGELDAEASADALLKKAQSAFGSKE